MKKSIAVYPGSFDPITLGHLDIIHRGLEIFDHLIVAVASNSGKEPLFTIEERLELARNALGASPRLEIDTFDGLLIDYLQAKGADIILRGLRAVSDFEYEYQVAQTNHQLDPRIETLFLMTSIPYAFLSSSVVKEVASHHGAVDSFVPPLVRDALMRKFARPNLEE
ncbi:MAG: pantetheine-phosphate adenylyltransferase [Deltaproteobacteria bacterium]|nr:pantetheine-phosphate adenylyltransferase [Deltaproteobacteria bacterium]